MSYLNKRTAIPWQSLQGQFGADYDVPREFTRKAKVQLNKIRAFWPSVEFTYARGRLILAPSVGTCVGYTPLMTPHHAARSIEDAVALAERFREEGRYDLFRGQRENWRVVPTLARLNKEDMAAAGDRIKLFFSWMHAQPELGALANRDDLAIVDQKYAIAQHYEIPTLFCDFTLAPSVAGFFASSPNTSASDDTSVIVCCNSEDLTAFCKGHFSPDSRVGEVLRITVPNLWRLEAQAGVFLFLPVVNFDSSWYYFDRITFPRGSYTGIAAEDVYPTRRSPLEVLVHQYFQYEKKVVDRKAVMATNRRVIAGVTPEQMMEDGLIDGDPGPHESWIGASKEWTAYRVEQWFPASGTTRLHICDNLNAEPAQVGEEVRERVRKFLRDYEHARYEAVCLSSGTPELTGFMQRAQMLWDGVRSFPYSDEEIALAMANLSVLGLSLLRIPEPTGSSRPIQHIAQCLWDKPVQVEFGRRGAPDATAFVDESALMNALRPDFADILKPEYRKLASRAVDAVNVVQLPSRAFLFQPFASTFVTQVVPSQLILFRSKAHYFSPLQIETFGNP